MVQRFAIALGLLLTLPWIVRADETIDGTDVAVPIGEQVLLEPVTPLSLAELEAIALGNNPTITAAVARQDAARGRQLQAGLKPNPTVGYHATQMGNFGTSGQQGGFVAQRFIMGGKLRLDQAIAGKDIDVAGLQLSAQQLRVLSDVRVRFYDALIAERRVGLTGELDRIGKELVQSTQQLIAGRLETENDLLQAEIRAEEAAILLDNARNEQTESWRRLSAVVGIPTLQPLPLTGELDADLPELDWGSCYATVMANHPQLQAAQTRIERTRIVIDRAEQEPVPDVDLWVSVRRSNFTDSDVANVQLGIPLPIFDKNQGNIRAAQAEWIAAQNEARRVELELQDRLAVAYRRYANARQQVDRYRDRMVPKARRSLQLVTDAYDAGQAEYLTVLTAQQTYVNVALSYLDSLRELRAASSLIESQLLTDSLQPRP